MFKNIKSAFFWYYLYKFRKALILVLFLIVLIILTANIYEDINTYLLTSKQIYLIKYAILAKWIITIGSYCGIIAVFLSLFKKTHAKENLQEENISSKKEKYLKSKTHLRSHADILIAKKTLEKSKKMQNKKDLNLF